MMVLRHGGGGSGGFLAGKQVVPVNYEAEVSQRLIEASLCNDLKSALECLADPFIDVNYVGDVCLKIRKTGVVLREESPSEVRVDYEEFRTDATALFVAVTNGNSAFVRKLLVILLQLECSFVRRFHTLRWCFSPILFIDLLPKKLFLAANNGNSAFVRKSFGNFNLECLCLLSHIAVRIFFFLKK